MNIGMDGMILMGALIGVLGSCAIGSAAGGSRVRRWPSASAYSSACSSPSSSSSSRADEFIIGCALNIVRTPA